MNPILGQKLGPFPQLPTNELSVNPIPESAGRPAIPSQLESINEPSARLPYQEPISTIGRSAAGHPMSGLPNVASPSRPVISENNPNIIQRSKGIHPMGGLPNVQISGPALPIENTPNPIPHSAPAATPQGYEFYFNNANGTPKIIRAGPAQGLQLQSIELDPITRQPVKWIYADPFGGPPQAFSQPQGLSAADALRAKMGK